MGEKERATEDFFHQIDKQLEEMESSAGKAAPTGAVPKQKRNKSKGKGRNRSKSNTPAKVMSPEPLIQLKSKTSKLMSPEPKTEEKSVNSEKKEVIPSEDISVSKDAQASESKEGEKEEAQSQLQNEDLKKKDL